MPAVIVQTIPDGAIHAGQQYQAVWAMRTIRIYVAGAEPGDHGVTAVKVSRSSAEAKLHFALHTEFA